MILQEFTLSWKFFMRMTPIKSDSVNGPHHPLLPNFLMLHNQIILRSIIIIITFLITRILVLQPPCPLRNIRPRDIISSMRINVAPLHHVNQVILEPQLPPASLPDDKTLDRNQLSRIAAPVALVLQLPNFLRRNSEDRILSVTWLWN